jgi:hypothetical protein
VGESWQYQQSKVELALRALPAIIDAIERDEAVIEFVGH